MRCMHKRFHVQALSRIYIILSIYICIVITNLYDSSMYIMYVLVHVSTVHALQLPTLRNHRILRIYITNMIE